jgi:hypothetical protein
VPLDYDKSIEFQNLPVAFPGKGSEYEKLVWRLAFNIRWVCATMLKITGKESNRLLPFVFNRGQLWVYWLMLDQWRNGRPVRLWILKGRQFGISTLMSAILFIAGALWNRNCLQLSHRESAGKTMFGKIERFRQHFAHTVTNGNTQHTLLTEPSVRAAGDLLMWNTKDKQALIKRESAENKDAGVSETFQVVHLTEGPLWADMGHTMGGLLPTIPATDPDSMIVAEFTARGEGDYTHQIWVQCMAGQAAFQGVFLPWYWHEDYSRPRTPEDPPLARWQREYMAHVKKVGYEYPLESGTLRLKPQFAAIRKKRPFVPQDMATGFRLTDAHMLWLGDRLKEYAGDMDVLNREYPPTPEVAFQSSGRRVIPPGVMDQLDAASRDHRMIDRGEYEGRRGLGGRTKRAYVKRDDGRVHRFEMPQADAYYVLDADTSSGVGADYSAAHILKVEPGLITAVVSFQGKVRPPEFAAILSRMGMHYRSHAHWSDTPGKLDPRSGVPSLIVVERNNHGEHVIYELTQNLGYKRLYRHEERGKKDNWKLGHQYGFPVTRSNKIPMLVHLGQVAYDGGLLVPCERTRLEMRNLVYLDDMDEKAGAPVGVHDDLAMAIGEGVFVAASRGGFKGGRLTQNGSSDSKPMMFPVVGR